uniref:SWIM-type domain-containing protein n=1 Tax=Cajanus cajan TaxID=3821 RepID=A0A151RU90_CAJCA|nr:hypothetical protein KK1_032285 [Cajanus cajan]
MWCDCGKFQKVHIPCSHVLASCLHAHHNYQTYISPIYTLQQVAKIYERQFRELRHKDYWPTYIGPTMWPNPELKRNSKVRPKSSKIRTEIDIREQPTGRVGPGFKTLLNTPNIIRIKLN